MNIVVGSSSESYLFVQNLIESYFVQNLFLSFFNETIGISSVTKLLILKICLYVSTHIVPLITWNTIS